MPIAKANERFLNISQWGASKNTSANEILQVLSRNNVIIRLVYWCKVMNKTSIIIRSLHKIKNIENIERGPKAAFFIPIIIIYLS